VSISTAVERLNALGDTVERTSLSRYIKNHNINSIRSGRETLVSFAALVNHRRTNELLGPAAHNLPHMGMGGDASSQTFASTPVSIAQASKSDGQSRKWAADADLRELELAQKTGQLIERASIESAAVEAITAMETAMLGSLNVTAEAMAEEFRAEPRRVRQRLRAMVENGLADFRRIVEGLQQTAG
jgi:hypothetical protein